MHTYLQSKESEMLSLIERLVNIDSGSNNKKGIDAIGTILRAEYEQLGFLVETVEQPNNGNHLVIKHKNATNPQIFLCAHMDTVFKDGTAAERPFTIKGDRAYGPGVIDMKSSHVALLYALKALILDEQQGVENVCIVLNSDEEIGSPTSRKLIEATAAGKQYALIMEPARKDGSFVSARRGGGSYSLFVTGKAVHAGIEPQNGRSAIEELAQKIIKLHKLTDHEEGISVNVGLIEGGDSVNTVAPSAVAHVDIRISRMEQQEYLDNCVKAICVTPDVPGTSIKLTGGINRPPMVKNEKTVELLEVVKAVGEPLGITIADTATGGGSDASFTSGIGIPTLDGFGPVGGNVHSEEEYLEIPTLVERTHLLSKVIAHLSTTKS